MKWRGPEKDGDQWPTLGHQVAWMIQHSCAIPDGEYAGSPYILTDEMYRHLLNLYRLDPKTGRFVHFRGSQIVRPQGWGKGPFSAAWVCAEAQGPALFDRWATKAGVDAWGYEFQAGDPVGRPWPTPLIQITAATESQTDNVFRALIPMIELGNIRADIPDTGQTRINLPGGGRIEPVTSKARSRLGARLTAAVEDQTESWWESNGGRRLADTQRRNLAKMGGRFLETCNSWDPLDESVAQQTSEGKELGVYLDDIEPGPGSIHNKRERRRCMKKVYGDSMTAPKGAEWVPWVPPERIDGEIETLLARDPEQAERFFLNRKMATESAAFDYEKWAALADSKIVVPDKSLIVIGIDGARYDDALALVATDVEQAHQWPLGIWEVPKAEENNDEYEHPFDEVDGTLTDAFSRFQMWRVYIDPGSSTGNITPLVDKWKGRWGDKVVIEWPMNRDTPVGKAVANYAMAINAGDLTHDGDEVMARHIRNARRRKLKALDPDTHRQLWTISKDRPMSPRKMDGAAAGVLSWEARGDAIAAGATKTEKPGAFYAFS